MRSLVVVLAVACSQPAPPRPAPPPAPAPAPAVRTLTVIGTNDLHGAISRLPLFGGYVATIRAERAADGGGVVLVDGGDLFQGTLESNLAEGADIVRAYNQLGYVASAIGNHEFDYGPEGPTTIAKPGEDPRGAIKARIHEAKFPFLASNILDASTGHRIDWPNAPASMLIDVAGIPVGIVGASTEQTPTTTMPANFAGLAIAPPSQTIAAEAQALRARGARVVIAIAHVGSSCRDVDHPDDISSCDQDEELFRVIAAMPPGTIDVFVAGHTHAMVAHHIRGVAVIESMSSGRAFGRVDVRLTGDRITALDIRKPRLICPLDKEGNPQPIATCKPEPYDGQPVVADAAVQTIVDEAQRRAGQRRDEKLGVTFTTTVTKAYGSESAEGDLLTELMLAAQPRADVALANGGGLRADLPAGALTYGQLFEAMPFDNRFALVRVTGSQLRKMIRANLMRGAGILSWAGLAAIARCKDGKLDVQIRVGGKALADATTYTIVTSDFLASGGDGLFPRLHLPATAITMTDTIIRDAVAEVLRGRQETIDPSQRFGQRRLDYEGKRPVRCSETQVEDEP